MIIKIVSKSYNLKNDIVPDAGMYNFMGSHLKETLHSLCVETTTGELLKEKYST